HHRLMGEVQLLQHGSGGAELPFPAVDDQQVGEASTLVEPATKIPRAGFGEGAEIVVPPFAPDPAATIFRPVGSPAGPEYTGVHGLASLRVRDVEAGDRPWHVWQLQDLLELVQCIWSPSRGSVAEQLTLLEEVTGVLRRQLDEAYLVATSGNQRTNRSPRAAP